MVGRRLMSLLKNKTGTTGSPPAAAVAEGEGQSWGRKIVSGALISLTGGVALSALGDLIIFYGCSSKAMERATKNGTIIEAIGEPIVRGPWYNASLAVSHKRRSVSCSFPASGPQGTGIFQLKAVCSGDDSWFSYLWPRDWKILVMEAMLYVPANEGSRKNLRVSVWDDSSPPPPACQMCTVRGPQLPSEGCRKKSTSA